MEEVWKEVWIDGAFTGKMVSSMGRLRDCNGKILNLYNNGAGYLAANMGIRLNTKGNMNTKFIYIHRLVAMYFLPNPHNLPQVNHKDFDKSNNCESNLEWSKRSDNIDHAHAGGKMKKRSGLATIVRLTEDQVKECYTRVKLGEGVNAVAKSIGKSRTTISSIMNKRSRSSITNKIDAELLELAEMKYLEEV